ncbi:MAG TPA: hypothetical protein VMS17_24315 [Gemmataceae bacterium]|nr:hypothetical protein [Gemmataceae bacterium]
MARAKKYPLTIDWQGMRKVMGEEEFTRQVGPLLKEIPPETYLAQLNPKQRRELLRRLQESLASEE